MKFLIFLLCTLTLVPLSAEENSISHRDKPNRFYTRYIDRGNTFDGEAIIYTAENPALEWSQNIGSYTNGCTDITTCTYDINSGEDSYAYKMCERIGGRLPTAFEVNRLASQFEHTPGNSNYEDLMTPWNEITKEGARSFLRHFRGVNEYMSMWVSKVSTERYYARKYGYYFEVSSFNTRSSAYKNAKRNRRLEVRCVKPYTAGII